MYIQIKIQALFVAVDNSKILLAEFFIWELVWLTGKKLKKLGAEYFDVINCNK
jgi:hypothetical protein